MFAQLKQKSKEETLRLAAAAADRSDAASAATGAGSDGEDAGQAVRIATLEARLRDLVRAYKAWWQQ